MGQIEMDELRRQLHLRHEGHIRVVFQYPYTAPLFEHIPCAEYMLWEPSRQWWCCPDCSYELTTEEVFEIANLLVDATKRFKSDAERKKGKGFWTWFSEKFLGRRRRLPP